MRIVSFLKGYFNYITVKGEKKINLGTVLEKRAKQHQDKPLLLYGETVISYREFNERANKVSHLFLQDGYAKGDTVALYMNNRPEFLIYHAGLAKIGVVPALINYNIKGEVLAHALNIAEAKAVIVGNEYTRELFDIKNKIQLEATGTIYVDYSDTNNVDHSEALDTGFININEQLEFQSTDNPKVDYTITAGDILEYIYTSGTTGYPKATALRHQKWLQLGSGLGGVCLRALKTDIMYCCLPLYHNSGINIAWATTVIHGCTMALNSKFSARNFWNDIRNYKANLFIYVGELCRYIYNQPEKSDDKNNTLEYILGNGLRGDYWCEFQKRFGIKKIVEVYGATEGVGGLSNLKGVPGMIGKLKVMGMQMGEVVRYDIDKDDFIRDENGFLQKCTFGETGMFLAKISGTSPFTGYKKNKQATNEKMLTNVFKKGDSFFISGDLFKLHKNGYVSFEDRIGDSFKWKGEVVATNEVSDIISKFGVFEDCNVYGVAVNNTEGKTGMAALTILPGVRFDLNTFSGYVIKHLPVYARPYFIRMRNSKDITSSFKQIKKTLQKEGFNLHIINDSLYFLHPDNNVYTVLDEKLYNDIQSGKIRF